MLLSILRLMENRHGMSRPVVALIRSAAVLVCILIALAIWTSIPRQTDFVFPDGFNGKVRVYVDIPNAKVGSWHWKAGGWQQTIVIDDNGKASIPARTVSEMNSKFRTVLRARFVNGQTIPIATWSDERQGAPGGVKLFLRSCGGPDHKATGPEYYASFCDYFVGTSKAFMTLDLHE